MDNKKSINSYLLVIVMWEKQHYFGDLHKVIS